MAFPLACNIFARLACSLVKTQLGRSPSAMERIRSHLRSKEMTYKS